MTSLTRWLAQPPALRWPWQRRLDLESDHGHRPYAAWEAELSAYARLRAGVPMEVEFGFVTTAEWGEKVHLARPPANLPVGEAFRLAELDLEHLLMHFRQGSREIALYWQTWRRPSDTVRLPWPPWDEVDLLGRIAREAIVKGDIGFEVPPEADVWPERQRDAALWIASAWADGVHRAREIAERPGMALRLPLPLSSTRSAPWPDLLYALATGADTAGSALGDDARAILRDAGVDDPAQHTRAVIQAVALLAKRGALPPAHRQRPPWLHPLWGRWRRAVAIHRVLSEFARSPTSAEMATATARARAGRTLVPPFGTGSLLHGAARSGLARRQRSDPNAKGQPMALENEEQNEEVEWGAPSGAELPHAGTAGPLHGEQGTREGRGDDGPFGGGFAGAGPGTLGALRVVDETPSDRAAYWQMRGALAPDIERLIERLRAASGHDDAATPRRFQRSGRIDRNRLPAALTGREAVFIRHVRRPEPAHALTLLLDCSASMTLRAEHLRQAAILVESAAAAVGARVTAFTFGPAWERMEPPAEGAPLVALGRELHPHG